MEAKAFATMKEENHFPKPFLIDEEANEFKLVDSSSYPKKAWGLFLQQSTTLCRNTKSGIKNTVSCVFHRYPLALPSIKKVTLAFILVFLFFSLFLLLKANGLVARYPFGYHETIIVPIKEAVPKNLSVTILLESRKAEPFCEAMENCFDTAVKEFRSEPEIVKENAKMTLECNGTRREFVSGKGENHIEVSWMDGQTHYKVKEANSQVYVARLHSLGRQPLPLNLGSVLKVYQRLASLEGSEELQQCLNEVIEEFPKEPYVVQDNAVLEVSCGGSNVTFRSGAGKNEINVYKNKQEKIVFNVKGREWAWWARLFVKH